MPIEAGPGLETFAGALVRRGEAVAEVTATGSRTKFGRTAELVRAAHVVSSQQKAVFRVVRNLAAFNGTDRARARRLRLLAGHAIRRACSADPDFGARFNPGRVAGHVYAGDRHWRAGAGKIGRPSDPALRGR